MSEDRNVPGFENLGKRSDVIKMAVSQHNRRWFSTAKMRFGPAADSAVGHRQTGVNQDPAFSCGDCEVRSQA